MLSCNNLSARYDQNLIFCNLGLCLTPGSLIVVTGKNGSGKSSLLKILAGLSIPAEGKVFYQDDDIFLNSDNYFKNLNYISHKNSLNKESSVLDSLNFLANMRGNNILVEAAVSYFNLFELLHLPVGKLSAGWQRRVALARLIFCPTKIWLLDEPESNLDYQGKALLSNLIKVKTDNNGIVMISTHNEDWLEQQILFKLHMEDYADKS